MAYLDSKVKKTVRIPLIGVPNYRADIAEDQRYVNVYVESIDNKMAQNQLFYCVKRPGLIKILRPTNGNAVGRGVYTWRGDLYSVFDSKVFKNGTQLVVTLTTTTGICEMVETSAIAPTPYLALNDGAFLYLIDVNGVVTKVTDGDYPFTDNTANVVFFDGYTIVAQTTGFIWNSDNEDPTSWDPLSFIAAQMFPDDLVAICRQNNLLVALGQWSTEFFYDAGTAPPGSFMARLDQSALQIGCASNGSLIQHENFVIWVARAQTGGYTVQKLDGITNLKPVSSEPIERILNDEGENIVNSYALALRTAGHFFYILNLTQSKRTFVYDITEDRWTEWAYDGGPFNFIRAIQYNGVSVLQHATNGTIYSMDITTYQDDGINVDVSVQTAKYDADTSKRKVCSRFELVGDIQDTASPVNVQFTDNDYQTFSTARLMDTGTRAWLPRLGSFRRRAWKLTHSHNSPFRAEAYEMDLQIGET